MYGKIKWYKENKGYGYIIGADEETYFFEKIDCVNINDTFSEGEEVLFIPSFVGIASASKVEKV